MVQVGERVDHFTLIEHLGSNQFGTVWTARESITERLVRLTFLDHGGDYEIARFSRAIALLSRLNHSAIVAHTGHGFHRRRPYLATEHVQGPTIASLLDSGARRMEEIKVLQLAIQLADGLAHAWSTAEIIHRTLGPETVLIDLASMQEEHGHLRIKLMDFGNALGRRLIDQYDPAEVSEEAAFQLAAQRELVGNPLTMAPEQFQGARLTVGCDMYALGVTMHLLLAGAPPFAGNDQELRKAHLHAVPLDLRQLVPGIQAGTATVVRRLLAKEPDGRFPDWPACRAKLQPLLEALEREQPARPASATATIRRTVTFESTPKGTAIKGGVEGGGLGLSPVPSSVAAFRRDDERLLFALLAARLNNVGQTSSAVLAEPGVTPLIKDGLTASQRAAVWDFLFRNPAIYEASVTASGPMEAQLETPITIVRRQAAVDTPPLVFVPTPPSVLAPVRNKPASPLVAPELEPQSADSPEPPHPRRPRPSTPREPQDKSADSPEPASSALQDELDSFTESLAFAHLFTVPAPGAAPVTSEVLTSTAPVEAVTDIPRNPLQSPLWKVGFELLNQQFLGRIRYQPETVASGGFTKRITTSLRRLVPSSREQSLAEIRVALEAGRFDEADRLLDRLAAAGSTHGQAGNDATMCLLRARIQGLRKDLPGTLRWAQDAVHMQCDDGLALALVGLCHLKARRVPSAMQIFDELARTHPDSPLGPLGQAVILTIAGLTAKASQVLTEAEGRESHPGTISVRALLCRVTGDRAGEVAQLRRLLTGTAADWDIQERIHELLGGIQQVPADG